MNKKFILTLMTIILTSTITFAAPMPKKYYNIKTGKLVKNCKFEKQKMYNLTKSTADANQTYRECIEKNKMTDPEYSTTATSSPIKYSPVLIWQTKLTAATCSAEYVVKPKPMIVGSEIKYKVITKTSNPEFHRNNCIKKLLTDIEKKHPGIQKNTGERIMQANN